MAGSGPRRVLRVIPTVFPERWVGVTKFPYLADCNAHLAGNEDEDVDVDHDDGDRIIYPFLPFCLRLYFLIS